MADRDKVLARKSRIASTRVVSVFTEYKDEAYDFVCPHSTPQTDTGLKKVFELTCPGQPTFVARWDQKDWELYEEGELDIDVFGVDEANVDSFKDEKDGSSGHHTRSLGDGKYRVDLVYKGMKIFLGVVHVGIGKEGEFGSDMKFDALFKV